MRFEETLRPALYLPPLEKLLHSVPAPKHLLHFRCEHVGGKIRRKGTIDKGVLERSHSARNHRLIVVGWLYKIYRGYRLCTTIISVCLAIAEVTFFVSTVVATNCGGAFSPGGPGVGLRPAFMAFRISLVLNFAYFTRGWTSSTSSGQSY